MSLRPPYKKLQEYDSTIAPSDITLDCWGAALLFLKLLWDTVLVDFSRNKVDKFSQFSLFNLSCGDRFLTTCTISARFYAALCRFELSFKQWSILDNQAIYLSEILQNSMYFINIYQLDLLPFYTYKCVFVLTPIFLFG